MKKVDSIYRIVQFPGKTTIDYTQEEAERTVFSHQKRRGKEDFIAAFNSEMGGD